MLTYETYVPDGARDGAPVLILLHGRGSDEKDLLGLQPGLPSDAILVTLRAPFSGAALGYGGGWAWYRLLDGTTPDPQMFEQSIAALAELVEALPDLLPVRTGPVVVGGFSQGGTTALGFALIHRDKVDGVLMFSGFLPSHPAVQVLTESVSGLRVFWGHGTLDQMIPLGRVVPGRDALTRAGADLTAGDYRIGHWIDPRELADAAQWLESFARSPVAPR